jgi:hypothetical protein
VPDAKLEPPAPPSFRPIPVRDPIAMPEPAPPAVPPKPFDDPKIFDNLDQHAFEVCVCVKAFPKKKNHFKN